TALPSSSTMVACVKTPSPNYQVQRRGEAPTARGRANARERRTRARPRPSTLWSPRPLQRRVRRHGRKVMNTTQFRTYSHKLPAELSRAPFVPNAIAEVCNRTERTPQLAEG